MSKQIAKGSRVEVTGPSSTENGTRGVVESVRPGWTGPEAVVIVSGGVRNRRITVPVVDLSPR